MLINQIATFLSNTSVLYLFSVIDNSRFNFGGKFKFIDFREKPTFTSEQSDSKSLRARLRRVYHRILHTPRFFWTKNPSPKKLIFTRKWNVRSYRILPKVAQLM